MIAEARHRLAVMAVVMTIGSSCLVAQNVGDPGIVNKKGVPVDTRSQGRIIADEVAAHGAIVLDEVGPVPALGVVPQVQLRGGNSQVNDPALDNFQVFPGFRPFVKFTQSETAIAARGQNIVAVYNTSANQPLVQVGTSLAYSHRFLSGYSRSGDGGKTWQSGFMPPMPGSIFTFGDPVVAVDRAGTFYFSGLGADSAGHSTIQVNRSTDGGATWSPAVAVQQDNGGDKEWLAVGPDPVTKNRDNVYVTWTSFQASGAQLRFGRSTDGGVTFTSKTIFAPGPNADPTKPQNSLQFSAPYVDPVRGRLYIPFIQFSNADADFIRVLISDDAGETFSWATFNALGAPDATTLPVVSAGELTDCRSGGGRLSIHAGTPYAGRAGLRSFVQTSRLITQPTLAARNGVVYLAWSNSTSTIYGDPNGGSNVWFIRSDDGGATWGPRAQVNPAVATDIHHVLPSLAIGDDPNAVHVAYYTQHTNGQLDLDMANSHDRGATFPAARTVRVTSAPFDLPPTNVQLSASTSTNYDRTIAACYALGEYIGITAANGTVFTSWADGRKTVTEPVSPLNPLSGITHAQQDVFVQAVKAQ